MTQFSPHLEVLPSEQRTIWPMLAATTELRLVLYGGTAVALRLGHRRSVDFDFFTEKPLDFEKLRLTLPVLRESRVIQSQLDTLSVLVPVQATSVKLSFFGSITIGRAGVPERTEDGVLEVASLLDLLATKLKVIQQRIESKDYSDIVAVLRAGVRLEDGLAAAASMYAPAFQPMEAVRSLTYFHGGDLDRLTTGDREALMQAAARVRRIPERLLVSRALSSAE